MSNGYASGAASSGLGFLGVVFWIFFICYLVAWVLTMGIVTKAAKEKGYDDIAWKLWFIGLFALIFTAPIVVAALPDKRLQSISGSSNSDASVTDQSDELPDL